MSNTLAGYLRESVEQLKMSVAAIQAQHELLLKSCARAPSITEEIDTLPGRRIYYSQVGRVAFSAVDNGRRGAPVSLQISQDGPFVQTHYPFALWLPTAPANATNFGLWRPVAAAYPLPVQATPASTNYEANEDVVALSYEVVDAGSQRNFQNQPVPPILSRPDLLIPLSVPTLFAPNAAIQFHPTYESIRFSATVAPTAGVLVVALPGYRIVNM